MKKKTMENEERDELGFFNHKPEDDIDIFCNLCLQVPLYSVVIEKDETIKLTHECKDNKEENIIFPFKREKNLVVRAICNYCQNKCTKFCLECKKFVCKDCEKFHIPNENQDNIIVFSDYGLNNKKEKIEKEKYNYFYKQAQFFCDKHFIQYQYFCPICRKNLCSNCKDFHVHFNCQSLFKCNQVKNIKIISWNSLQKDLVSNLVLLCKVFERDYIEAEANQMITINIIGNYGLIRDINIFLKIYKEKARLNKQKIIKSNLFNSEKEENYLCMKFYDGRFIEKYSTLIEKMKLGDYEYRHNLLVIQKYYQNKKLCENKNNFNDISFNIAIKGTINYFRALFHELSEDLSKIDSKIRINYLNEEISKLKLTIDTLDVEINLLKQININLLYKYNYQLRRKAGNLLSEKIISNYSEQIYIEPNDYILLESIIQLKKKIKDANNLIGDKKIIDEYKNNLEEHLKTILSTANSDLLDKLAKLSSKDNKKDEMFEDENEDAKIQINPVDGNYKEPVLLNIFFNLREKYGKKFNHSIHNNTEYVNMQIFEKIKMLENKDISVSDKQEESSKIQKKKNNESDNENTIEPEDKKCPFYFNIVNKIKTSFDIKESFLPEKKEILNLINNQFDSEVEKDDFKSELSKLFKNYKFDNSINFNNATHLFLNGEITDILSEKLIYESIEDLKKKLNQDELNKMKNEIVKDIQEIEPLINGYLENSERIKKFLFKTLRKNREYIHLENRIDKSRNNPYENLKKISTINLEGLDDDSASNIYLVFLINLYLYAEYVCDYYQTLKKTYKDLKMINILEKNTEKKELLKAFETKIKYDMPDILKEIWNDLKKETTYVEKNKTLNDKIKEYLTINDNKNFLKDLNNIDKLKNQKINLKKPDPQYLAVKAFFYKQKIPVELPEGVIIKKDM